MDPDVSIKEEVKRAADIVEFIGQFVQLKRAGQNYLGLCPFHAEKDPSFTVSPSKQMFHCFGCKKGGDVFAFWMEYHKVSFPEALRDLAERYQVPIPRGSLESGQREKWTERASLLKVNEVACDHYRRTLVDSDKGKPGREYLKQRGITQEIVTAFKLGYAPDEWDSLCKAFKRGELEKARDAGLLISKKKGGFYDRFRGRIMFPICDLRGQILGFGGRVIDHSLPKYLNTPESPLFHKGRVLYGLHASFEAVRKTGRVVIVEGYMDLLALRKHGFQEAVATLGTALTREHIRLLKGYAREAIVVFDSDFAGRTAASRSLSGFLDEGLQAKVLLLPENEDPDSYLSKNGLRPFLALLSRSVPIFDFFVDLRLSEAGDSIEGQVTAMKEIIPLLNELRNAAQRSHYVRRLSQKLGVDESGVIEEMHKWAASHSWEGRETTLRKKVSDSKARSQDDSFLLNLMVHHPRVLGAMVKLDFGVLLSDPAVRAIYDLMVETVRKEGKATPADLLERLGEEPAKQLLREALLSRSMVGDEEVDLAMKEYEDRIHKIRIAESKSRAWERGDLQELNRIPKLKKNRWG